MIAQVFQVDPAPELEPFTFEDSALASFGAELVLGNCTSEAEVIARAQAAEILWVNWEPLVTRRVLEGLPRCRLVVRWGVGYEQIPVPDATELGVAVANAPAYGTDDVAEHTIAMLLAAARHLPWLHSEMAGGGYPDVTIRPIHRLTGRSLGIVGVGRIGKAVAWRARGLGLRVIGYDRSVPDDELRSLGIEPMPLDDLIVGADFVSVHVPLNDSTRSLINRERLLLLRDRFLINTSRGPVVDESALAELLKERHLAGAALDVYSTEPLATTSPLRSLDNVILTPHSAGYSIEALADMRSDMCNTAREWLTTGWSERVVNTDVRSHLRTPVASA